jgi:hypothetical protein
MSVHRSSGKRAQPIDLRLQPPCRRTQVSRSLYVNEDGETDPIALMIRRERGPLCPERRGTDAKSNQKLVKTTQDVHHHTR